MPLLSVDPSSTTTTSASTVGCQLSWRRAAEMSGRRRTGSSAGRGWCTTGLAAPVTASTSWASSSTDTSSGLPMLTGPASGECSSATMPSTWSDT